MISRYEAYMDGVSLSSLDPSIFVLDILTGDIEQQIQTRNVYGRAGARIGKIDISKATVSVQFEIHEYDTRKRQAICQKVQRWARKGTLVVSDRPGQRIDVICESFPIANAKSWTEPLTITFVAYYPYWEEINATTISFTGAGSKSVFIPGNAPEALVSASITCGGSVSSITVTAGSTSIALSDLEASSGDVITIGYDIDRVLYIKKNNVSILIKRSALSSDDLKVECGKFNTFAISASGTVTATVMVRGCWY